VMTIQPPRAGSIRVVQNVLLEMGDSVTQNRELGVCSSTGRVVLLQPRSCDLSHSQADSCTNPEIGIERGGHLLPRGQSEGETLFDVLVDAGKRAMFDFLRDTLDGDGDSGTNRHALAAGELVTASVPSGAAHPMYDSGNSCGESGVDTNTSAPPGREKGHVT